jgi:predicted site-specific integrase-resolvase
MTTSTDLVSTAEAAQILRVRTSTVNKWASDGTLTVALSGNGRTGARFYERTTVEALAAERRQADLEKWGAAS